MIYAHLVVEQVKSSIVQQKGPGRISIGIFFVSDKESTEEYYSNAIKKQQEGFKSESVQGILREYERFLCYHGFIPAGQTNTERTYYLPSTAPMK